MVTAAPRKSSARRVFPTPGSPSINAMRLPSVDAVLQAAKLVSEQALLYPLYYSYDVKAHVSTLKGPLPYAPSGNVTWGIEQWTLES